MSALSHILASDPDEPPTSRSSPPPPPAEANATSVHRAGSPMSTAKRSEHADEDAASNPKGDGPLSDQVPQDESNQNASANASKRNAASSSSSVYSGNKIRHLKKEDGIPLWRRDIQYDFLDRVFRDNTKCFTNYPDGSKGYTFAQIYIDAMAKSSKCSKVLKDKLMQGIEGGISMAMVCLLVNIGRMNTTLNFFPEMRAQLRTYHSIPALQARQDPNAYKQLQDAPRLKSILKGAQEDTAQPSSLDDLPSRSVPRTNPVNLIFVMSSQAPKVSDQHFPAGTDFFDLVMRSSLSSASRARAFLWLMWFYLESDFSGKAALENPFGPGQVPKSKPGALPLEVPPLESLTEEQASLENEDTPDEKEFGEIKRKERIAILASEPSPAMTALKRAKQKGLSSSHIYHASDDEGSDVGWYKASENKLATTKLETGSEYTRSPSPVPSRNLHVMGTNKPAGDMRINNLLNSDDPMDGSPPGTATNSLAGAAKKSSGRGNWRRKRGIDTAGVSRPSQEGSHHVPLLPNTGQINFVNDGPQSLGASSSFHLNGNTTKSGGSPSHGSLVSFHSSRDHVPTPSYQAQKRHRGITQHQSAVINHRKLQIDYTLDRRIRWLHMRSKGKREAESSMLRAWKRVRLMPLDYDSEEEAVKIRKAKEKSEKTDDDGTWRTGAGHRNGGSKENNDDIYDGVDISRRPRLLLSGFIRENGETNDIGEEARGLAQTFRRCSRRIERWESGEMPGETMAKRRRAALNPRRESDRASRRLRRRRSYSEDEHSVEHDGYEMAAAKSASARDGSRRQRNGGRRSSSYRARGHGGKASHDVEAEVDAEEDDGGGGDLDEEDRELLGEVDADGDESEDEDGDEDMDES